MRFEVDDNNCYVQCVYNCGKPRLLSMLKILERNYKQS